MLVEQRLIPPVQCRGQIESNQRFLSSHRYRQKVSECCYQ
jgi:hypothetical protein